MEQELGIFLDPSTVTQRHALYDSDEEEETEENVSGCFSTSAETQLQELSKCTLLIAVGQTAAIFTKSYLVLDPDPCSIITTNSPKALKNKYFAEKGVLAEGEVLPVSELYRVKKKSTSSGPIIVCIHEQPLSSEYCNPWSQKLFEHVHPETVFILHSLPSHEHFSPHPHDEDALFLRSLKSSSWPHPCHTPFLEPPNTIIGEPAAALTHCQVFNMAASLVVLYSTFSRSEAERVAALQPLLKHPPLTDAVETKSEAEAIQLVKKQLPRKREDYSSLYT